MYLILAGGFWNAYRKAFGRIPFTDDSEGARLADCIIKIEGLPESMLAPIDKEYRDKYWCGTCEKPIPSWEMEQKYGCYNHKVVTHSTEVPVYPAQAYEPYTIPRFKWLSPMMRIWVNNVQGLDKFKQIWRYVESKYPATKLPPLPKPVGNKKEWTIFAPEDIDVIYLNGLDKDELPQPQSIAEVHSESELVKPRTKKNKRNFPIVKCDICGKECKGNGILSLHKKQYHKVEKEPVA